jgi:hypothetical protein
MKSLAIALLSLSTFIVSTKTFAQELSIGSETISSSGIATVALDISGLSPGTTALGTFDVNVGFNSSVVSFASATYGDPTLGDQLNFNGLAFSATTSGSGNAELFELSLDDASTLLSSQQGGFTLATLTFDALTTGTSALALSINALGDENGNSLSASLKDGSITVTGAGGGATQAPEIEANSAVSALTLLLGSLIILNGRALDYRTPSRVALHCGVRIRKV